MTSVREFYTAAELEQLGYVRDRLVELFGDPDQTDSEDRGSRETVFAVERDVLAPAAQQIFTAFEPDFDTRAGMIAAVSGSGGRRWSRCSRVSPYGSRPAPTAASSEDVARGECAAK
ncbi:hypothetical protein ACFTZB_29905 [Rhodococcus sp. NPDC057014]|uniref:hypothetical protein n=1 Tax=Rhodococcus sp. NPDC057014 TaxID=3346000 RepID=UPI00363DCEDD